MCSRRAIRRKTGTHQVIVFSAHHRSNGTGTPYCNQNKFFFFAGHQEGQRLARPDHPIPRCSLHPMAGLYLSAAMLVPAAVDFSISTIRLVACLRSLLFRRCGFLAAATANPRSQMRRFPRRNFGLLLAGHLLWVVCSVNRSHAVLIWHRLGLDKWPTPFRIRVTVTHPPGATGDFWARFGATGIVLLWRFPCWQWIGGIGIVALGLLCARSSRSAASPSSRIGILRHLRETVRRRFAVFVRALLAIYIGLTPEAAPSSTRSLGMSGFDAINHAMTTNATGGFSTHDAILRPPSSPTALIWTANHSCHAIAACPFSC